MWDKGNIAVPSSKMQSLTYSTYLRLYYSSTEEIIKHSKAVDINIKLIVVFHIQKGWRIIQQAVLACGDISSAMFQLSPESREY